MSEKVYKSHRREFIKLEQGQNIEGIWFGTVKTRFGPAYRLVTKDGIQYLGGNRVQLDAIIEEMQLDSEGFPDGIAGHLIQIRRLEGSATSEKGYEVALYEIAHLVDDCPKGCSLA